MNYIYLRLSAPLQSWAGPKVSGNISRTENGPTRSGLEGLIAGAMGRHRGEPADYQDRLSFRVRRDNPGVIVDEFHTINPRPETESYQERLFTLLNAKRATRKTATFTPDAQGGTTIANRTFLAGAEFIVQIEAPEDLERIDAALASPHFMNYLGRKAFAPQFPFYLGVSPDDVLAEIPVLRQKDTIAGRKQDIPTDVTTLVEVTMFERLGITQRTNIRAPLSPDRESWLKDVKELRLHRRHSWQ